jgi:2-C-methyl-D-erythritol 4-phosphate cytidylyltransferase
MGLGYAPPMRVAALVLGAGRGERLGHAAPKAFVALAGRPLIAWSLETLARCEEIDRIVPVVPASRRVGLLAGLGALAGCAKLAPPVAGGVERQDSLRAGLDALPPEFGWVAVHDAARPLLRAAAVARVVAAARECGAALLATPVADTIKRVRDGVVLETPSREECYAAQTPQVFRRDWLAEGLTRATAAGRRVSDCAQLVEALGVRIRVVAGDPDNFKVTHPGDLAAAERWLSERGDAA